MQQQRNGCERGRYYLVWEKPFDLIEILLGKSPCIGCKLKKINFLQNLLKECYLSHKLFAANCIFIHKLFVQQCQWLILASVHGFDASSRHRKWFVVSRTGLVGLCWVHWFLITLKPQISESPDRNFLYFVKICISVFEFKTCYIYSFYIF